MSPQRPPMPSRPATPPADAVKLGQTLEFMRVIWGISHGLQSTSKRMEASLGITGPQRLVVRIVGRYSGISAGELARILRLHPSTLTGILRRLEERHVIERRRGARDRRAAHLRLTRAGRAVDRRRRGTVEHAVQRVLSRLDQDKIAAAEEVLGALEKALTVQKGDRRSRSTSSSGGLSPSRGRGARPVTQR